MRWRLLMSRFHVSLDVTSTCIEEYARHKIKSNSILFSSHGNVFMLKNNVEQIALQVCFNMTFNFKAYRMYVVCKNHKCHSTMQ